MSTVCFYPGSRVPLRGRTQNRSPASLTSLEAETSGLQQQVQSHGTSLLFSNLTLIVFLVLTTTFQKSRLSMDMVSSGMVRLATNSIEYEGPYFTSIGTTLLTLPNLAFFLVVQTTLKSTDQLGGNFCTLSGSIAIPQVARIFLSKEKLIGSLPTLVYLKDFFLMAPTTTLPKSHIQVAMLMLSSWTIVVPIAMVAPGRPPPPEIEPFSSLSAPLRFPQVLFRPPFLFKGFLGDLTKESFKLVEPLISYVEL